MSAIDGFLSRLDKVRQTSNGKWLACCPSHEDSRPSLSIKEGDDGRVLVHCFAGCNVGEVAAAVGIDLSDLFPPKSRSYDGKSGERHPFSAADILRALQLELILVSVAACNLAKGIELDQDDRDRLLLASERVLAASASYA